MMPMTVGEFARRSGATLVGVEPETTFYRFALDSRDAGPGSIFLAIEGARVDGHNYVELAIANGAVTVVVEHEVEGPHILVENLVDALAKMAESFRDEFDGIVIGITGSAGKTSTKELLAAALSPLGKIGKTSGNRNTEFTVPLAWAELKGVEAAMIVEMSMRGLGQIAHLAAISKPSVGIITNVGSNHAEKVGSILGVVMAKSELFEALPPKGLAIFEYECDFAETLRQSANCEQATFGWTAGADAQLTSYKPISWQESKFSILIDDQKSQATIPTVGKHMAQNAAAAILCAVRLGVSIQDACDAIAQTELPEMRMQPISANGATIVLDNYNAAPQSFVAAIETLASLPSAGRRIVVAGEMKELGDESEAGHREVGRALALAKVDDVIFFGEAMQSALEEAGECGLERQRMVVASSLDDISSQMRELRSGDTVLVKGSRALELENAFAFLLNEREAKQA
jgi:UDP-N-acetylmuramoyl-tripeptide--D-alanyl-D-alanine ligase